MVSKFLEWIGKRAREAYEDPELRQAAKNYFWKSVGAPQEDEEFQGFSQEFHRRYSGSFDASNADTEIDNDEYVSLRDLEANIKSVERVDVAFINRKSGRDARSDRGLLPKYPFRKKASGDRTVSYLLCERLGIYNGYGLRGVVKYADGAVAHGKTHLSEVRKGYGKR